jgi:hypothetical protein
MGEFNSGSTDSRACRCECACADVNDLVCTAGRAAPDVTGRALALRIALVQHAVE